MNEEKALDEALQKYLTRAAILVPGEPELDVVDGFKAGWFAASEFRKAGMVQIAEAVKNLDAEVNRCLSVIEQQDALPQLAQPAAIKPDGTFRIHRVEPISFEAMNAAIQHVKRRSHDRVQSLSEKTEILKKICTERQIVKINADLFERAVAQMSRASSVDTRSENLRFYHALVGLGAEEIFVRAGVGRLNDTPAFDVLLDEGLPIGPKLEVKTSADSGISYDHRIQFQYWQPLKPNPSLLTLIEAGTDLIGHELEYTYVRTDIWDGKTRKRFIWLDHER